MNPFVKTLVAESHIQLLEVNLLSQLICFSQLQRHGFFHPSARVQSVLHLDCYLHAVLVDLSYNLSSGFEVLSLLEERQQSATRPILHSVPWTCSQFFLGHRCCSEISNVRLRPGGN